MELIPILSLIILVATISTFVLAVGAYILYKIRERKGKIATASQPAAIPGEMIAPAPLMTEQRGTRTSYAETGTGFRTGYRTGEPERQQFQQKPIFTTQQNSMTSPGLRPTYSQAPTSAFTQQRRTTAVPTNYQGTSESESYTDKKKFMRYTNEGYIKATKEHKKEEDSLRWR